MEYLEQNRERLPEEIPGRVYGYTPYPYLFLRGIIGGFAAGLAAIVPGVSGGTMLLAAGIYPFFLESLYDITRRRFGVRDALVLATVLVSHVLSVTFLAPSVRALMLDHRYMMFALFAGLTVGGIPVVYGMVRPFTKRVFVSAVVAFLCVLGLHALRVLLSRPIGEHVGMPWYFAGGVVSGAALVLPGVSGAHLLMAMGLFGRFIDEIDLLRQALADGTLPSAFGPAASILFPMAAGALVGVFALARIFHRLLIRDPRATMGALLGLLVSALAELWPFQQGVAPNVGDVVGGRTMTAELVANMPPERYPIAYYTPDAKQLLIAIVVFAGGVVITALVARFGSRTVSGLDLAARSQA